MWGWSKHHAERATAASWTSWRTRELRPTVTDPEPWTETAHTETETAARSTTAQPVAAGSTTARLAAARSAAATEQGETRAAATSAAAERVGAGAEVAEVGSPESEPADDYVANRVVAPVGMAKSTGGPAPMGFAMATANRLRDNDSRVAPPRLNAAGPEPFATAPGDQGSPPLVGVSAQLQAATAPR